MPEITEIRKYADFIKECTKKEDMLDIKILNGRYKKHKPFDNFSLLKKNLPLKIIDVKTKGKLLYFILDNNIYIKTTMGLSGGWCYLKQRSTDYLFSDVMNEYENNGDYIKNAINHRNVEFVFRSGSLYYYDVLSFGTIKVMDDIKDLEKELKKLGPDIMDEDTTFNIFKERILMTKNMEKKIGNVIVDQKTISGIGNYLRSDVLYMSKINPFRIVSSLTNDQIKKIFNNSKILTWGDYDIRKARRMGIIKKTTKLPSNYDRLFFVYDQT